MGWERKQLTNNNSNKGYLSKYLKISKDKVPNGFSGFLGFTIQSFKTIRTIDITLSTKVCLVKAMVFPVVMYACESWTIKTAEHQRIDAFELWCWRRLLRVPWTAKRSNQSILNKSVLNSHWKD